MKAAIVSSRELGTNCWLPARFLGGRCARVMTCSYPEKAKCKAVETEIEYLTAHYSGEIERLTEQRDKALESLKASKR